MHRQTLAVLGLLLLAGCPVTPRTETDSGPVPDASTGDMCGTIEGLDDPPEFVGSCLGSPDSAGDQGCTEVTTRPNAIIIGTACQRASCESGAGNMWISGRCGGRFMYCGELRDDEGLLNQFFATNPASCPSM